LILLPDMAKVGYGNFTWRRRPGRTLRIRLRPKYPF
jgi:hypothetical protein